MCVSCHCVSVFDLIDLCNDSDNKCDFCENQEDTTKHLFYECQYQDSGKKQDYFDTQTNYLIKLEANDLPPFSVKLFFILLFIY